MESINFFNNLEMYNIFRRQPNNLNIVLIYNMRPFQNPKKTNAQKKNPKENYHDEPNLWDVEGSLYRLPE